jgi:serine/threonine protein kinase
MTVDAGTTIAGKYLVEKEIRKETMATLYAARDTSADRPVWLKVIHPHLVVKGKFVERFRQEAEIMAELDLPQVPKVLDQGVEGETHYIVMEQVTGSFLEDTLQRFGVLEVDQALSYVQQVAECLHMVNLRGVVHRDIRPANIIVTPANSVKVVNFGLARSAEDEGFTMTEALGTPDYISPEQAEGGEVDTRSDIYSLGVTIYELLAGEPPYRGPSPMEVVMKHISAPIPSVRHARPDVSVEVDGIIERCMAKNPDDRYQTPAELVARIREVLGQPPVELPTELAAGLAALTAPADEVVAPPPPPPEEVAAPPEVEEEVTPPPPPVEVEPEPVAEEAVEYGPGEELKKGQMLGQYRIEGIIGVGGMATVYKAFQPDVGRHVAIKVLPRYFAHDPAFVERFKREARTIARLEHTHILPMYDYGEEQGLTYIVMRYMEAGTLREVIVQGPVELDKTAHIIRQVASALDYAHKNKVIHRDLKPSNILIDKQGDAYLSDFGIAKLTEAKSQITGASIVGTPAYLSPEQGHGKEIDGRSDVYSLGVILFEMLTGKVPYDGPTPLSIALKHVNEPVPLPRSINPDVPEAVESVILKALAKAPEDRYQTAGEMARELRQAVEAPEKVAAAPPPPVEVEPEPVPLPVQIEAKPLSEEKRGLPIVPIAIGGGAILLLIIAVLLLFSGGGEPGEKKATEAPQTAVAVATPTPMAGPTPTPTLTTPALAGEEIGSGVYEGDLSADESRDLYWLEVPEALEVLGVRLKVSPEADYDLYVRQGAPPEAAAGGFDCGSENKDLGAEEGCEIKEPAPGVYYLMVHRVEGTGDYSLEVEFATLSEPTHTPVPGPTPTPAKPTEELCFMGELEEYIGISGNMMQLEGHIRDWQGNPLPGVPIRMRRPEWNFEQSAWGSRPDGYYLVDGLVQAGVWKMDLPDRKSTPFDVELVPNKKAVVNWQEKPCD